MKQRLDVGVVTAWCDSSDRPSAEEPQRSRCPDYVNEYKKLGSNR